MSGVIVVPIALKIKMYETVVVPALLRGAEVWAPHATDVHAMESFQGRSLTRIQGVSKFECLPHETLRVQLHFPRIEWRMRVERLRWLGHLMRMSASRTPALFYRGSIHLPSTTSFRQTRALTWAAQIVYDLRDVHVPPSEVEERCANREEWRRVIHTPLPIDSEEAVAQRTCHDCDLLFTKPVLMREHTVTSVSCPARLLQWAIQKIQAETSAIRL